MSGKWGPFFLSSFPLCFFLALLPLCSWDSSSPLFVVSLHSHAPNLVHTMSTSHLHYLVQVGMLLFTNPSRRKVTKVIYWARLLASCDMNWAPREIVESYSCRSRSPPPSIIVLSVHISNSKSAHVCIPGDEACIAFA